MTLTQQLAQFIASGIVNGTIYALLGLGLVAIHSVTRVVNVAQGEFAALGALLASTLVARGMPLSLAAGVAVVAAAAAGGGVYRTGIRPARDAGPLAGALGGLAGVLITPLTLATYDMGLILGLKGFVGVVMAGMSSYPWTVGACILFGVVESLGAGLISSNYRDGIAFGVLVAALLWRALSVLRGGLIVSEETAQE